MSYLVETIQLKKTKDLSTLCHTCKNLYNIGNYYINNYYDVFEEYINWYDTKWMLKTNPQYRKLPSQTAQNVLKYLHLAWKSYFESLKDYKIHPNKYEGIPRPPKYLKYDDEYVACFDYPNIKIKDNKICFPKKTNLKPIEVVTKNDELHQVRIVPKGDRYNLEIVYKKENIDLKYDKERIIGIDIGLNNLACVVNNIGLNPFVINGRPLKSINHYYNRELSKKQKKKSMEMLDINKKKFIGKIYKKDGKLTKKFIDFNNNQAYYKLQQTKSMKKLRRVRYNKIKDYMHKSSRFIIDFCMENNIGMIVIGKNDDWKQKIKMGKKNNQNFVQIPFTMLINMITYKANMVGIDVILITEEYTSKCSFLDDEEIGKKKVYKGKRVKRGLFVASDGRYINADVNGAYNILKKAFPNAISADGILVPQWYPRIINLDTKSKLVMIKT